MNIFRNKVIIITGSASGIGYALSKQLANQGARLVMTDINEGQLNAAAEEISMVSGTVTPAVLDVTDFEAVNRQVEDTVAQYGRLDYIFNNAGIVIPGDARDFSCEDWHRVIDINLYGVIHGVAAAYPLMCRQGFGHIVNIASLAGLIPATGAVSYTASKYGVVGLSHALRIEAADLGVKVSVVCPGLVDTPINNYQSAVNLDRERMRDSLPTSIQMSPEKCAKGILQGVEKNRSTILITPAAKIFGPLQRISPKLVMLIWKQFIRKMRSARINN